jgi:hypothetical protein
MKCFRIYTENKRDGVAERLTAAHFDAFNITETTGFWKGQREDSIVIEILAADGYALKVDALAGELRRELQQEAVLVTAHDVDSKLITE